MDPDFLLVFGLVFICFGGLSLVEAFSHASPPRLAALLFVTGGSMMVWAVSQKPGGYSFGEVPGIVVAVVRSAVG